jgi:hypothetical protein
VTSTKRGSRDPDQFLIIGPVPVFKEARMTNRAIAIALLALVIPGCAHNAEWMQRQPGVESTIGTDFNKAPAGKVIPPPGLGVDLSYQSDDANSKCRRSSTSA